MTEQCKATDVSLKSYFLGPQSENATWFQAAVNDLLIRWFDWRQSRYVEDGRAISPKDQASSGFKDRRKQVAGALNELSTRFEAEIPKYSPRYAGHMFSEIAMPALLGHLAALLHNPNIISGESARIAVHVEDEAIADLAKMVGFNLERHAGHFTSGGTIANFESVVRARARVALWMSLGAALAEVRQAKPDPCRDSMMGWPDFDAGIKFLSKHTSDWSQLLESWNFEKIGFSAFAKKMFDKFGVPTQYPVMLVPSHKHYCWPKAASIFGFGDETMKLVHLDSMGRLDPDHLRTRIKQSIQHGHPVMMVVSVAGTTELGVVDPIGEVNLVVQEFGSIWHHVDGAYGGFFASMNKEFCPNLSSELDGAMRAVASVDSMTIDPHKLGYVPYAAGVFMVANGRDYDLRAITAPYIQYSGKDRGPSTIEGSRPATGAAATWMLSKTLGFNSDGLGRVIMRNIEGRRLLEQELQNMKHPVRIVKTTDANVLCFVVADEGESLSVVNQRTKKIYEKLAHFDSRFTVSKTTITWQHYGALCERFSGSWGAACDTGEIVLLRMCLMNPFFTSKETAISYPREFALEVESIVNLI